MPAVRLIEPPRRVYNSSGSGQGNITIDSVVGTGLYFHEAFVQGDYFEYGLYNLSLNEAETGWGIIENLASGLGVMSRNVDRSTDGVGVALNLQAGQSYVLFLKKSDGRTISEDPSTSKASKPEVITKTVNVLDWSEIQTQTLSNTAVAQRFWVGQGPAQDDGNAGLWEWRPGSLAAPNDIVNDTTVTVIQSTAHPSSGRYHNVPISPAIIDYSTLASIPFRTFGFDSTGGDEVKFNHSVRGLMNVGIFTRYPKGVYETIAQWKAVASSVWVDGDEILILGKSQYGDCVPFKITWDQDNTNTAALDFTHYRPDDIAGVNQGRAVRTEPLLASKFTDSDATPSLKGDTFWTTANISPVGGITAFDDVLEGEVYWIVPGSADCLIKASAGLAKDYILKAATAPALVTKVGGAVKVFLSDNQQNSVDEVNGDGTNTVDINIVTDIDRALVFVGGAPVYPSQITSITANSPSVGMSRIVFSFNVAAADTVLVKG